MILYCSCNDLDKRPDKGVMGSSMLQVPESMISLDLLMAASSFVDKWGLVDVGQLGPAARAGIFIPERLGRSWPPLRDHWRVFRDRESVRPFLLTSDQENYVRANVRQLDNTHRSAAKSRREKMDIYVTCMYGTLFSFFDLRFNERPT